MVDHAKNKAVNKLSAEEIERYARHIALREVGGSGQRKLLNAKILVIGAGGLGSPILQYLAAAGVGKIGVIDDDLVSISNLQRQVLFDVDQLNEPKVTAALTRLKKINPHVEVVAINQRLTKDNARELFKGYHLVVDGCDNFPTRYLVNDMCFQLEIPLLSGAISQWEGQVCLFNTKIGTPCYACVFPSEPKDGLAPTCFEGGVMGALPGIVGSIMASEVIKWISGAGAGLAGEMLIFDALFGETRKIRLYKKPNCKTCSNASVENNGNATLEAEN